MKSDPPAPAVPQNLLRQQLILAQVRIMELEDLRDELTPRIQTAEKLQSAAQAIADEQSALARHLETVAAAQAGQIAAAGKLTEQLHHDLADAHTVNREQHAELIRLRRELDLIATELTAMRASRSWRWTAWLRSIGL